ncbi:MAG: cytochrome c biogenesis protein CcsA [Chloroflexota bacterium]|nr:cytochrome c biogenesis protein CcsA [Chloroflexota bacterium]
MTAKTELLSPRRTVGERPMPVLLRLLTILTLVGFCFTLVLGLFVAGRDIQQGEIQRIFYIHMPSFFGAFTAFGLTVVGGILYLWRKSEQWDRIALAGVEVGLAFALINLATGAIWARPIWNTWWTWDPRLTSAAIMALTYAAYLMLRAGIEDEARKRSFMSVYGIFAFTSVLVTLFIIRVVPETIHPVIVGASPQNAQGSFEATSGVVTALIPSLLLWLTVMPITLIWHRARIERRLEAINRLKMQILSE